jgi:hypothetical protein
MASVAIKRVTATALAGAAIACALCAPTASARPIEAFVPGSAGDIADGRTVPPPPSSIAVPAAEEYGDLRSPGPSESRPVVDEPSSPEGFDLPSAAIGAATGAGLLIMVLAAGSLVRRRPLTRRHGVAVPQAARRQA